MYSNKIGLIDIGSNTIRLVIYNVDNHFDILEHVNIKTPARLSEDLTINKDGQTIMTTTGINKLIDCLTHFKHVTDSQHVNDLIIIATAALRQSANREEIVQKVQQAIGLTIRILSEKEEASYGQYSIAHSMSIRDFVSIDIGGGSCEITLTRNKKIQAYHSLPFGVVTLKDLFFENRSHRDPKAIQAAREYIRSQFKQLEWLRKVKLPIVAIGGSARNIVQVHQRLQRYPIEGLHGYRLSDINLQTTLDLFCQTPMVEMEDIDGLSSDRTDIIIPANLAFIELYDVVKAPTLYVSNQGLREGVLTHYLNENFNQAIDPELIRVRSVQSLCRKFKISIEAAQLRTNTIIKLYQQLCDLNQFEYDYATQETLEFAAYLYQCGSFISQEAKSQHTFYLLSNMNLTGFPHRARVRLAILASYKNRSLLYQYLEPFNLWYTEKEIEEMVRLGGLLKFAQALSNSKTPVIQDLVIDPQPSRYILQVYHNGPISTEKYQVDRCLNHLERAIDGPVTVHFIPIEA